MLEKSCLDETRKKNKVGIRGFLRLNTGNFRGEKIMKIRNSNNRF